MLSWLKYIFCPWSIISELRKEVEEIELALMNENYQRMVTAAALIIQAGKDGAQFVSSDTIGFVLSQDNLKVDLVHDAEGVTMRVIYGAGPDSGVDEDCGGDCEQCDGGCHS